MAKDKKKKKESLKSQFKENKQLLLGISFAISMLLFASLGARSDFFKTKEKSKPVPDELTKNLTPSPKTENRPVDKSCVVTGCSGQICSDEEVTTTCEYKEIYSCYKTATCEVQPDGECGWAMDEKLRDCLQSYVGEPSL
jgi:eight-cysteine-cluster-containing protein